MKISIVGAGYVGMAYLTLLSKKNKVTIIDNSQNKLNDLTNGVSPVKEKDIEDNLKKNLKNINAKNILNYSFEKDDVIFLCLPTNYNEKSNSLDTTIIEELLQKIANENQNAFVIIKSTIPVGFTENAYKKYKIKNLIFSPEFLRESQSFKDVKNPSRIIFGCCMENIDEFVKVYNKLFDYDQQPLFISPTEAESVKIFSNTYLAMRVAYFNELDNFCIKNNLNSKNIINGVCLDNRIGNMYNNPSFGYGGYCLIKDSKQCASLNLDNVLIGQINNSNEKRKQIIAADILKQLGDKNNIGIYKLSFKNGSDNCRESAIIDIIKMLKQAGKKIYIYSNLNDDKNILDCEKINTVNEFFEKSDIIVTNRYDEYTRNIKNVYCRDIFFRD